SATLLEGLREVPVVERDERHNARAKQTIYQMVVEVESSGAGAARALREDAWPGDGETVRLQPQVLHDGDVTAPAVVMIVGDIARVTVEHAARHMRKPVPDRLATTVLAHRPFDLIG